MAGCTEIPDVWREPNRASNDYNSNRASYPRVAANVQRQKRRTPPRILDHLRLQAP